jgi:RNA polymerase sigma-70 factor (ECF subfamily)
MTRVVPDERLLTAAAQGDEMAFLVLYERHRDPLYRFLRRYCGSAELAEDVTHDCFLSLIRTPSRYDPGQASLRTYLCGAGRNLLVSRLRREGRETPMDDEADGDPLGLRETAAGPLDRVLTREVQDVVADALARLPPRQREAILLFEYEELTLAEIAHVAGTDVGTIKSRLWRARGTLRRWLLPVRQKESV